MNILARTVQEAEKFFKEEYGGPNPFDPSQIVFCHKVDNRDFMNIVSRNNLENKVKVKSFGIEGIPPIKYIDLRLNGEFIYTVIL